MTTKLDNSQSTVSSNVVQEIVEERKKPDAVFRRVNNTARNKTEKFNNFGNSLQNSSSKPKVSNESYCSPYNGNYFSTNNILSRIHDNLKYLYIYRKYCKNLL